MRRSAIDDSYGRSRLGRELDRVEDLRNRVVSGGSVLETEL